MAPPRKPVELTEAEWRIMKALWDGEPCTAPDLQARLEPGTGWTYSTVRTLMDRLVGKGLLAARKQGKLTLFKSRVTREQAQRGELQYALKHAFDGAMPPLVQCLLDTGGLSESELDEIEAMIRSRRRHGRK